jgi:hypothetical protein
MVVLTIWSFSIFSIQASSANCKAASAVAVIAKDLVKLNLRRTSMPKA